jgi:hypothetical protein
MADVLSRGREAGSLWVCGCVLIAGNPHFSGCDWLIIIIKITLGSSVVKQLNLHLYLYI